MEKSSTDHIRDGYEAFSNKRFELCMRALLCALPDVEADAVNAEECGEKGDWRLLSGLHACIGQCFMALASYDSAGLVFHKAQLYLKRHGLYRPEEMELLRRWTADSAASEKLKNRYNALEANVEELCKAESLAQADELCQREHDLGVAEVGAGTWYCAMVKYLSAACKIQLCKQASRDEIDPLVEEAQRLCAEAQEICAQAGEHPVWLSRIDEFAAGLQEFAEERRQQPDGVDPEPDGFLAFRDWTPEGDRAEEQAEHRSSPHREQPPILRNWAQPFRGVRFTLLKGEWQQALEGADQLFTRHEYALCFEELKKVMRLAEAHNDRLLFSLIMVMSARCNQSLGDYAGAQYALQMAMRELTNVGEIGPRMIGQLQELLARVKADEALQVQLREEIEPHLKQLCQQGKFDEAARACDVHLIRTESLLGEDHWFCNVAIAMKAKVLVARASACDKKEARQFFDEFLDDAGQLLDKATSGVEAHGHDVYWVKTKLVVPVRDDLWELLDQ